MGGTLKVNWRSLRHDCNPPSTRKLATDGASEVTLRWRCDVCGQRWRARWIYSATTWRRDGGPSWRWRKAEARKIVAEHKRKTEST